MIILLDEFLEKKQNYQKTFSPSKVYKGKIILFLDIDGVLHPLLTKDYFNKVHIINNILTEFPNILVVISSSWAAKMSLEDLKKYFPLEIRDKIIGSITLQPFRHRGKNIRLWIQQNIEICKTYPWIAVDDAALFDDNDPVYWTDSRDGLTEDDLKYLKKIFYNPIEYYKFKNKDNL